MHSLTPQRIALACALLLGVAAAAPSAWAQVGPVDNPGQLLQQGAAMAPHMQVQHKDVPPALPGATTSSVVAPATQIPSEMSPNAALFDAINRGDAAGARDALSRGAELSARNVLGLTPMELSVDLGRNEISFLLLSYRGQGDSGAAPAAPSATGVAAAKALAKQPAKPIRTAERTSSARRTAAADAPADPPQAPQAPRLFANDGGTPVPSAGFLGFNSQGAAH